jgi:hypothetical protein
MCRLSRELSDDSYVEDWQTAPGTEPLFDVGGVLQALRGAIEKIPEDFLW